MTSSPPAGKAARHSAPITTLVTSAAFFLTAMNLLLTNAALPSIVADIGGGMTEQQWVADGYNLMFATLLLCAGNLSDRFGAKRMFVGGTTLYAAAAAFCALSQSMPMLIAGVCVMGVASAMIQPSSMALIKEANPDAKERAKAMSLWATGGSAASIVGPMLGGALAPISWSLVYAVNIPFCLVALALCVKVKPSPMRPTRFDWTGQALALAGVACLLGGIIQGGEAGFSAPHIIVLIVVGAAALVAFVFSQSRVASPMMPLSLFASKGMRFALVIAFFMIFNWYSLTFIVNLELQQGQGMSALQAGMVIVPSAFTNIVANLASGRLANAKGVKFTLLCGMSSMILGFAGALALGEPVNPLLLTVCVCLISSGGALMTPALSNLVLTSVDESQAGIASALYNTFRQVGGAMGIAVMGTVTGALPSLAAGLTTVLSCGGALIILLLVAVALLWRGRGK